jgi:hypothetical protein
MERRCTNHGDGRLVGAYWVRLLVCAAVVIFCAAPAANALPIDDTPLEMDLGIVILLAGVASLGLMALYGLSPGSHMRFVGLRFSSHACPADADAPPRIPARAPPC